MKNKFCLFSCLTVMLVLLAVIFVPDIGINTANVDGYTLPDDGAALRTAVLADGVYNDTFVYKGVKFDGVIHHLKSGNLADLPITPLLVVRFHHDQLFLNDRPKSDDNKKKYSARIWMNCPDRCLSDYISYNMNSGISPVLMFWREEVKRFSGDTFVRENYDDESEFYTVDEYFISVGLRPSAEPVVIELRRSQESTDDVLHRLDRLNLASIIAARYGSIEW